MFKIPNTGSHTIVWTHENAAYSYKWVALLLRPLLPYPEFFTWGNEVLSKQQPKTTKSLWHRAIIDGRCHKYHFCCDKHVFVTTKHIFRCEKDILLQQKLFQFNSNSIKKTLIIPQGAILLWSWRAHKKQHKVKRTLQHNTTNKRDLL